MNLVQYVQKKGWRYDYPIYRDAWMDNEEMAFELAKTLKGGMRAVDEAKKRPTYTIRKKYIDFLSRREVRAERSPVIPKFEDPNYPLVLEKVPWTMTCRSRLQMQDESSLSSIKERVPANLESEQGENSD